ncbi:nitrogenase-associated protein [Synechococcus sp. PCC 7335]|uniref:hypothetical protein n=1 Tax=Synechococcus sp. (strain ATCC 29403 / PCC 7335) TaxID=91464 RepID=UPI00017EBBC6|nr:hypothetical protein [Synechococcus sp. PCC 7335]EDX87746.1 nitrogenase-associated protein [Synechococcus sp. PCC 7335]
MAAVDFYEKPGCIGNAKQKRFLWNAGHVLTVHNLLTEPWTPETLRPFFGDLPVSDWFNPTAPPITRGEICPQRIEADAALLAMVGQLILIRRPLLQVGDRKMAGFDLAVIDRWVGLAADSDWKQDVQTCPRTASSSSS